MNKLPNVINLLILTLVTLLIWLTFTIYRSFTKEAPLVVPVEVVLPVNPRLDTTVIDEMEARIYPQGVVVTQEVVTEEVITQEAVTEEEVN